MRAHDQSSIFSTAGKFRPDYGLLLDGIVSYIYYLIKHRYTLLASLPKVQLYVYRVYIPNIGTISSLYHIERVNCNQIIIYYGTLCMFCANCYCTFLEVCGIIPW